ncbi:uncharacterized protein LOC114359806 [Ostrinia furnacalis]|uniref:uncharacterized protein LOC114359806 n=1 Tax=Ostrinia furnacalis TaxID=93504 RepID=UPI00103B97A8|nr:uncharacterized protein LOC114359806 [Ostrinia furnacalis]
MTEKLKDYQVLDVFCGGTFYKVRHKVTNNIFAWKAYNCSAYSDAQIQNVVNEVKTISKVTSENLLRYYDTILHGPSKTLYFVLEYNSWRSVQELLDVCKATDKFFAEGFLWHLLLELARVCKLIEDLHFVVLQKCVTPDAIFVDEGGQLRVNCYDLATITRPDFMRQIGDIMHILCYRASATDTKIKEYHYSDDLSDVVGFLTDDKNVNLRPDVVLYHPTVLANLETHRRPKHLANILVAADYSHCASEANKCDSQKAVELCKVVEPAPRRIIKPVDSPIYINLSPKVSHNLQIEEAKSARGSLSPTLAALALELPGFVPRCRRPYSEAMERSACPQKVSEETLSQQWMTRLIALRQREESLNKRERDLIAKEIVNSPAAKIVPLNLNDTQDKPCEGESDGITLPPVITQAGERPEWVSRRRQRRSGSVRARPRRKSYAYEDLDSSLSADAGDGSIIVTSTRFTKDNMPRRNIFPEVGTKKVHFTSSNPFIESDESVTLTFYELENVDRDGYQLPRNETKPTKDISKFKYLDMEKMASEKRSAVNWSHSSPSKQARTSKNIFSDITNTSDANIRKTPSKSSLISKISNESRFSLSSVRSQWSVESSVSRASGGSVAERTRASARPGEVQTPPAPPELKKAKRKSLLPFKTPFKFKSSAKV